MYKCVQVFSLYRCRLNRAISLHFLQKVNFICLIRSWKYLPKLEVTCNLSLPTFGFDVSCSSILYRKLSVCLDHNYSWLLHTRLPQRVTIASVVIIPLVRMYHPLLVIGWMRPLCYISNSLSGHIQCWAYKYSHRKTLNQFTIIWQTWSVRYIYGMTLIMIIYFFLYKQLNIRLLHVLWLWLPWSRYAALPHSCWMTSRMLSRMSPPWLLASVTSALTSVSL